jgi:hypothetical protein
MLQMLQVWAKHVQQAQHKFQKAATTPTHPTLTSSHPNLKELRISKKAAEIRHFRHFYAIL